MPDGRLSSTRAHTSIMERDKTTLGGDRRMVIKVPPRLAARQVDDDDAGTLRGAIRDIREAVTAEVEPDVVQGRIRGHDGRGERDSSDLRSIEVEPDELRTSGRRGI